MACITETWLNPSISNNLTSVIGYTKYRVDRDDGRQGGGVAILVKDDLPCHVLALPNPERLETLWLLYRQSRMPHELSHILIGCVYFPPAANSGVMIEHLLNCLDAVSRKCSNTGIILLGDFNQLRDNALTSFPLKQIVKTPTRGLAILDKIYTNSAHWFLPPVILPAIGKSDHSAVLLTPTADQPRPHCYYQSVVRRSSDSNGKALLHLALKYHNWANFYSLTSCEEMTSHFYTALLAYLDFFLPMQHYINYSTDKPWVNSQFKQLIKKRQMAFLAGDKTAYRTYRNQVSHLSKKLRARYYEKKVEQLHKTDQHSWWKQVKKFLNIKQNSVYSALNISPNTSVPNAINEFFASVSGDLEPLRAEFLAKLTDDYSSQFIIEVAEVETRLSNINIYKAPGPDHLPSWILRDFAPLIAEPLAAIFNTSIRQGKVPDIWKSAVVIPAPKIHPPRSISSDFRPISLLSVLAKVLESFVANWLHDLLDPVLDPNQFGCLKGRSTAHALISVLHHWCQTLDKGGSVRALFVDFSKAFAELTIM